MNDEPIYRIPDNNRLPSNVWSDLHIGTQSAVTKARDLIEAARQASLAAAKALRHQAALQQLHGMPEAEQTAQLALEFDRDDAVAMEILADVFAARAAAEGAAGRNRLAEQLQIRAGHLRNGAAQLRAEAEQEGDDDA